MPGMIAAGQMNRLHSLLVGLAADQRALDTAMALPPLVLQALAHALDYLKAFSLETVLRVGAAFQPLHSVHEMSLSPNTLWWVPNLWSLSLSALTLMNYASSYGHFR